MLSLLVSFQGQACMCCLSPQPWSGGRWQASGGRSLGSWELVVTFYPPSFSHQSFPLPCHLIFTHISLPIEPAEGSWELPRKRNSCLWATYANMFTHEGILSKENLPHGNSLHVCRVALVSCSFKYEITGQIFSPAVSVIFMTWSKDDKLRGWSYTYIDFLWSLILGGYCTWIN